MNKIQKFSKYITLALNVLIIATPMLLIVNWALLPSKLGLSRIIQTPDELVDLSKVSLPPMLKLLAFSSDMIKLLPLFISLFILRNIFKSYQKGKIFSVENALSYRRLGVLFLLDAFFLKPLSGALMVLSITLNNPPGHRYLTISYGETNLTYLFYGLFVIIISWVMLEGSKLDEEQKFTI